MQSSVVVQIRLLLEAFLSPLGILACVVSIALLFVLTVHKSARWWAISVLLWVSTLGFYDQLWIDNTLVFPLEQIRRYGRPIAFVLLVLLLLPALASPRGWRTKLVHGGAIAYFVFELCFSGRLFLGGLIARGAAGAVVYTLIFLVFGTGLGRWMQTIREVHAVLWSIAGSGALFVFGTVYQLLINPSAAVTKTRLIATTGNPQAAALTIAVVLPAMCYLLMAKAGTRIARIILAATTGFLVLFLIWTGSRTGMLMTLIAMGLLFRTRIMRGMGIVLICGVFFLAASMVFTEGTVGAERFLSTTDTRTRDWLLLLNEFAASPIVGIVHEDVAVQENSYLTAAARSGIIGLTLLSVAGVFAMISLIGVLRDKRQLGEYVLLADLLAAGLVSLAIGANFEAFLVGTLTIPVFITYIYLAILAFLSDAVRFNRQQGVQEHA